jgi:tetratricopeptide (TPR) repeat protein
MRQLWVIALLLSLLALVPASVAQDSPTPYDQSLELALNKVTTVLSITIIIFPLIALLAGYLAVRRYQVLRQRVDQLENLALKPAQNNTELQTITDELQKVKRQLEETNKRVRETAAIKQDETTEIRTQLTRSLVQLEKSVAKQRDESVSAIRALALLPVGEKQYRVKDIDGALDTYKRALEMDDNNATIHYRLGYVYTQNGRLSEGLAHLTRALSIDPDFAPALAALGYARRRMAEKLPEGAERERQLDEAENMLLKALSASPKAVDEDGESWWGVLGGLYRRRGRVEQAIKAYENAAVITPYSSYPVNNLALLYLQDKGREAMLEAYRRSERLARSKIQATPDDYWAYADLLVSRVALGKTQEAEDALKLALELMPTDLPYAMSGLIETLEDLGKVLGNEAAHVQTSINYIREAATSNREKTTSTQEITRPSQTFTPSSNTSVVLENKRDAITFDNGHEAAVVRVSDEDDPAHVVQLLGIEQPQPSIFMLVGAMDMLSKEMTMTRPIIEEGLAKFANQHHIAIVDGGTASGVMKLMGDARIKSNATFPLVGVAPANQVKYPGHDNPTGYDLDSGHSHFVLTRDGEFGDETDMIVNLSYALAGSGKKPRLGMVVNGGDIVRQEVYRYATAPDSTLHLIVLEGSGRFADELAAAKRSGQADNDVVKAIVEKGHIELVSVSDGPDALRTCLNAFFGTPTK